MTADAVAEKVPTVASCSLDAPARTALRQNPAGKSVREVVR